LLQDAATRISIRLTTVSGQGSFSGTTVVYETETLRRLLKGSALLVALGCFWAMNATPGNGMRQVEDNRGRVSWVLNYRQLCFVPRAEVPHPNGPASTEWNFMLSSPSLFRQYKVGGGTRESFLSVISPRWRLKEFNIGYNAWRPYRRKLLTGILAMILHLHCAPVLKR